MTQQSSPPYAQHKPPAPNQVAGTPHAPSSVTLIRRGTRS
nr:MAG TPA: hypothetical protein [Caudoviricetes sp.]